MNLVHEQHVVGERVGLVTLSSPFANGDWLWGWSVYRPSRAHPATTLELLAIGVASTRERARAALEQELFAGVH